MKQGDTYEPMDKTLADDSDYDISNDSDNPIVAKFMNLDTKAKAAIGIGIVVVILLLTLPSIFKQTEEEWEEFVPTVPEEFTYNEVELASLQALGIPAIDIENMRLQEVAATRVAAAWSERQVEKAIAEAEELYIAESEFLQELMAQTWLRFPIQEVSYDSTWSGMDTTVRMNADYSKIRSSGNQCFVEVELKDGLIGFLMMHPDRFSQLPDSGNMLVQYQMVVYGGKTVITALDEIKFS